MLFAFKNLTDLLQTFDTEEKCKSYFEQARWKGRIICPHCGSEKIYRTKTKGVSGYKCATIGCNKKFSVTKGTVLEATNVPLQKWFAAMYLFTAHKKGISSCQLARDLGVTQKTAWFILHRVRIIFGVKNTPETMSGTLEVDETFIGGSEHNKHGNKERVREKRIAKRLAKSKGESYKGESNTENKIMVAGMIQRGGNLLFDSTVDKRNLKFFVRWNAVKGSTLYTDEKNTYKGLRSIYKHDFVTHSLQEYVRGDVHTNTIEGAFSLLKRGIYGIYHQVSPKHIAPYLNEFAFRYNTRKLADAERFDLAIHKSGGRLTYKQLINEKKEKNSN